MCDWALGAGELSDVPNGLTRLRVVGVPAVGCVAFALLLLLLLLLLMLLLLLLSGLDILAMLDDFSCGKGFAFIGAVLPVGGLSPPPGGFPPVKPATEGLFCAEAGDASIEDGVRLGIEVPPLIVV